MSRELTEMSLEELWQLFPVFLAKHNDLWKEWYFEEAAVLKKLIPEVKRISHVGSTAVPVICAKPIIDILVEISKDSNLLDYKYIIENCGYICMTENDKRVSFNKGYTKNGFAEKVFHLHLRQTGDNDEIYFRDYLIEHPEVANEYEKLKIRLQKKYRYHRDKYTTAKTDFVKKYTEKAKTLYKNRY